MGTPIDWSTFSAFNNTLSRDAIIDDTLSQPDPNQPNLLLADIEVGKDIQKFLKWLDIIRNLDQTAAQATFGQFAPDAHLVMSTFFAPDELPKRVLGTIGPDQFPQAAPIEVSYGDSQPLSKIKLADGASALAYLFSIAKAPDSPTWQNYHLPMLILLAKCTYLAFVRGSNNGVSDLCVQGVPTVVCATFVNDQNHPGTRFAFGSCFSVGSLSKGNQDPLNTKYTFMLDTWRRGFMNQSIRAKKDPAEIPTDVQFGYLSPLFMSQLRVTFATDLINKAEFKSAAIIAFEAIKLAQKVALDNDKTPAEQISLEEAWIYGSTRNPMIASLDKVIEARFDPGYNKDTFTSQYVMGLIDDFTAGYVTPKLFLPRNPPGKGPVKLQAPVKDPVDGPYLIARKTAILAFVQALVSAETVLNLVNKLFVDVTSGNIMPRNGGTWGRCAETYCFSCILPGWWGDANKAAKMTTVSGIAMSPRDIGTSKLKPFNTTTIGNIKDAYWRPCDNCKALIPRFAMVDTNYHQAMDAIPDKTHGVKYDPPKPKPPAV